MKLVISPDIILLTDGSRKPTCVISRETSKLLVVDQYTVGSQQSEQVNQSYTYSFVRQR